MTTIADIEDALRDVKSTLGADGFDLEVREVDQGRVVLAVTPGSEACADCLVPRSILTAVVAKHLQENGVALVADVLYPGDG
jgi:Fe-S cluster biogenesis protein NfuA